MESNKGLFRGSNWIGCSTVWSQWTIWWYSNSILSSPNIPKSHHMLLCYHDIHLYLCNFKCLFYLFTFMKGTLITFVVFLKLMYCSSIDLFHIYYLPILIQGLVPPNKNPPSPSPRAWFLRLEEIQFNRAKKPNAKDTKYGSTRDWWSVLLMEDIPHRLISKNIPGFFTGFHTLCRWYRTSSINSMIRFTQKIFSWNLSVIFVPSKTPPGDPNFDTKNGGSRYTQYTKLHDIIYVYMFIYFTLYQSNHFKVKDEWQNKKRRRTRGFWTVQGSTLLVTSGPEVVGCHWGCGFLFCDIEPYGCFRK